MIARRLILLPIVAVHLMMIQSADGAEIACISDWSVAAGIVETEGLATVEAVMKAAQGRVAGDVVKVTLCQDGSRYLYRLVVRTPAGQHQSLDVDARAPFGGT